MNRTVRNWLIAAVVLILVGGLAFAGVMTVLQWNFTSLNTVQYEEHSLTVSESFRNISICCDTEDIILVPSKDGICRAEFVLESDVIPSAAVENGTLKIAVTDNRNWRSRIGFSFTKSSVTLSLPEKAYASLEIEDTTGDLVIPADFSFESADLDLTTGHTDFSASVSGKIRIHRDTGDVVIASRSAGELDLSGTTGRTEIRSVACTGPVSVKSTTGDIVMTDAGCTDLNLVCTTGDIRMKHTLASGKLSVQLDTGSLKLERCDARELEIETDTGDVSASLLTEKTVSASSDTGRIRIPENMSGGSCSIRTETGDITVTIAE